MTIEYAIRDILNDVIGVYDVPNQIIDQIAEDDYLIDEDDDSIHDTSPRWLVIDLFCKLINVRAWPTYGEQADMEEFKKVLYNAALNSGCKLRED